MKVPMQWIREYTSIPENAAEYVERMVMTGTGVEGYETLGGEISNVVTGKVLSMERHPDSDHLWICQIDVAGERPLQIVTGAQNLHGGETVPVCVDGATLPGGHTIKTGKLRGVLSEGMLCSGSEGFLRAVHHLSALNFNILPGNNYIVPAFQGSAAGEIPQSAPANYNCRALSQIPEMGPVGLQHYRLGALAAYTPVGVYRNYSFHMLTPPQGSCR